MVTDEDIAKVLETENEEYRKLAAEHKTLKAKLAEIDAKVYMTPEQEQERATLKKLKLAKKDRMLQMIVEHKNKN